MTKGERGIGLRDLETLWSAGTAAGLTDAELLQRFTAHRDEHAETAFAALVERHAPMVLRVCSAVLRDAHDAQDAFQATFLVLVRRAKSLGSHDSLGPWLYHVAHRTALCARAASARRRRHEERAARLTPLYGRDGEHDDLAELVREEVERLPKRYRDAVLLCLLAGLSLEQAARHLGCPVQSARPKAGWRGAESGFEPG